MVTETPILSAISFSLTLITILLTIILDSLPIKLGKSLDRFWICRFWFLQYDESILISPLWLTDFRWIVSHSAESIPDYFTINLHKYLAAAMLKLIGQQDRKH